MKDNLTITEIDRVIEMAWEDRTAFEIIEIQFGLKESEVRALMKRELRFSSYVRWRKRVEDRNGHEQRGEMCRVNARESPPVERRLGHLRRQGPGQHESRKDEEESNPEESLPQDHGRHPRQRCEHEHVVREYEESCPPPQPREGVKARHPCRKRIVLRNDGAGHVAPS